ncbi:MAG: diaminopimelate decarboxylase [Candidatus Omnitrophica bacterium]|nr:diaminopimelate decarboxylase [Candidatus Omnitrophota bacterium]
MHEFKYVKNELYCEKVRVEDLARRHGTPLFLYSYHTLIDHFIKLRKAFRPVSPLICYSVKANSNLAILRALVDKGAGLDIVSGGELFRALKAGCPPERIVYASVGKTDREIEEAIRHGILFFNVESVSELENINRIAKRLSRRVNVALRINPDVEPKTHRYITTGRLTNKFGIDFRSAHQIFLLRGVLDHTRIAGLHIHIGSQITAAAPYVAAIKKMIGFIERARREGMTELEYLNIGGGLGVTYDREKPQTAASFASKILSLLKRTELKIIMEPGRFIAGQSGILVTKVLYMKKTPLKKFVIVDAGMNDLLRPSLYDAYHHILPLRKLSRAQEKVDIVGPICETADFLAKGRKIAKLQEGRFLAVFTAGAYASSMSSNYNSRLKAAEVMVVGKKSFLIRHRDTYDDLVRRETIPPFLLGI